MAGKSGSKNNIANRGTGAKVKKIDGKEVRPVKFKGAAGIFMAAALPDGKLVKGKNGLPVPYQSIN